MRITVIGDMTNIHARRWSAWFAARGHEVDAVSTGKTVSQPDLYPITDLCTLTNIPILKWLYWIIWLLLHLRRVKPDILHAHQVTGAGWLGAASRYHPFVLSAWGSDLYRFAPRSRWTRAATRLVLRRSDAVLGNSADLCHEAIYHGANREKVHQVTWGIDKRIFFSANAENTHGDSAIQPVKILSLRACTPTYNQHLILHAFAQLCQKYPNSRLSLSNYRADAAYHQDLLVLIDQLDIAKQVDWLDLSTREEDFAEALRNHDLAISFPSTDSASFAVQEALACGLPIIASDLPAMREIIRNGDNGVLVTPGNADALVDALTILLGDQGVRTRMRRAVIELAHELPDRDAAMQKAVAIYTMLLKQVSG